MRERKLSAWKQQVVAVISNTVCVYISVYIKRKKNLPLKIFPLIHSTRRCKSHLHLLIPSRKPFHRQPVRNKWSGREREREMENDDDGEKPQVFHSECTSVCCTQQHQLFFPLPLSVLFFVIIMNGVAAWITE